MFLGLSIGNKVEVRKDEVANLFLKLAHYNA